MKAMLYLLFITDDYTMPEKPLALQVKFFDIYIAALLAID